MKKYFSLLLLSLVMVMCFSVSVFAEETSYDVSAAGDGSVMATFDSDTGTLTISGNGAMADYTAYSSSNRYPVYPPYSSHLANVKKLVIEEGVTHIGNYAFYEGGYSYSVSMNALEEKVIFPSTLESIGYYAFYYASLPGDLVIPESVKTIENYAFTGAFGVTSVTFEEGVEWIGSIPTCDTITSIYIPATATNIPEISSTNLSEITIMTDGAGIFEINPISDTLGSNVSSKTATVKEGQYYLIECLEYLGYTVNTVAGEDLEPWESYPTGTYSYTPYVSEVGADGDNVRACYNPVSKTMKFWGEGAIKDFFYYSSSSSFNVLNPIAYIYGSINTVIFYDGITEIGNELFGYYINQYSTYAQTLTSVTLPETLIRIGSKAFTNLGASELVIPESVETIEANAFSGATTTTIYNLSEENQTIEDGAFNVSSTPTVYQYRANTAMETAVADVASEIIYFDDDSVVLSGTLDNGVTWEYDPATKTLTFSGDGEIPAYEDGSQPWYGAATQYGGVGSYAFGSGITGFTTGVVGSYGSSYGSNGSGSNFYYSSGSGVASSVGTYGSGGTYAGEASSGGSGSDSGSGSGSDSSDSSGSNDSTMIIVDAEPTNFLVTVPIKVVVTMDADGNIDCGSGYYVENDCAMGPVIITDIKVVAETNWNIVDWSSDFHNMKASSKNIALTINEVEVAAGGAVTLNDSLSSVIRNKEKKELTFDAKLPAQKSALQANAAAVVFTVDFDKV